MGVRRVTLLEIVMSTMLLSIIVAISALVLQYSLQQNNRDSSSAQFYMQINSTVDYLVAEISGSYVQNFYYLAGTQVSQNKNESEGMAIEYIPVAGNLSDDLSNVHYIRFKPFLGTIVRENDIDKDLNEDGDKADEYSLGYLEIAGNKISQRETVLSKKLQWNRFCDIPVLHQISSNRQFIFRMSKNKNQSLQINFRILFYHQAEKSTMLVDFFCAARSPQK